MRKFREGGNFANIQEYSNYPYSHLYFNSKLIGKAVTDNWQFRMIDGLIKNGMLKRAELNDGFSMYKVKVYVHYYDNNGIGCDLDEVYNVVSRDEYVARGEAIAKLASHYGMPYEEISIDTEVERV